MTRWIEIPQGRVLVNVTDEAAWRAVKLTFAFQGIRWRESPAKAGDTREPMSFGDFLLVASTCPCDLHLDELAEAMGFSPSWTPPRAP